VIEDRKELEDYLAEANDLVVECVKNNAFGMLLVGTPQGEFRMISLNSDMMEARLLVDCAWDVLKSELQDRTLQ